MKEGLWEVRMVDTIPGQKQTDNTYSLGRDHAHDQQVREKARKVLAACTTTSDATSDGKRTVVMSCKISGSDARPLAVRAHRGADILGLDGRG